LAGSEPADGALSPEQGIFRPHRRRGMNNEKQNQDDKAGKDDDKLPENSKKSLDEKLDEGVEETFPASDPVSVKITK
jgi:hypothetical protein